MRKLLLEAPGNIPGRENQALKEHSKSRNKIKPYGYIAPVRICLPEAVLAPETHPWAPKWDPIAQLRGLPMPGSP